MKVNNGNEKEAGPTTGRFAIGVPGARAVQQEEFRTRPGRFMAELQNENQIVWKNVTPCLYFLILKLLGA